MAPEIACGKQEYTYEYNLAGNATKVTDANGSVTRNEYNNYGQLTKSIDGLDKMAYYEYDSNGNTAQYTDRVGNVFTYAYDSMNRLISTTCGSDSYVNTYDVCGRLTGTTHGSESVGYTYYADGTLHTKTIGTKSISYAYDENSQPVSSTDWFGNTVTSVYSDRGLLLSKGDVDYSYNDDGTLAQTTLCDNTESYTYNDKAQLAGVTVTNSSGTAVYAESNTYNNYGNITVSAVTFKEDTGNGETYNHTYGYDVFGQLESENVTHKNGLGYTVQDGIVNGYGYDYAGNMTTDNGKNKYINANNQITRVTESDGSTSRYTYDDNGNLLTKTYADNTAESYTYDVWGHMLSYTDRQGKTVQYTYYADNLRKSKCVDGVTTQYYYDGDVVIDESENGELTAVNLIGVGNSIAARAEGDCTYAYMRNTHGDTAVVLDAENSHEPIRAYMYEAYGKIYKDMSDFYACNWNGYDSDYDNVILYAGQYLDKESGMYYLRARYYNLDLKRFTEEDTHWNYANMIYGDEPEKTKEEKTLPDYAAILQSNNRYAYCTNNPATHYDPTGHWMKEDMGAGYDSKTLQKLIEVSGEWQEASKNGDQAGMDAAHAKAEEIKKMPEQELKKKPQSMKQVNPQEGQTTIIQIMKRTIMQIM